MKRNKKVLSNILLIACIAYISCVTNNGASGNDELTLDEAIEQSAIELVKKLDPGVRVAIVAFSSEHDNISNFIMDELTGAMVDGNLEVADRRNLAYVYRELNYQMSGDVSDETAVSIGKFLGAQYVISGQFIRAGNRYRYRLSGINVETAIQVSSARLNVQNNRLLQNLIVDLRQNSVLTAVADYGVPQSTIPKTVGAYLDRGILFASRGEWDMAIADFTEAIKLDSNFATAYMLRGRAFYAAASSVTGTGENFGSIITVIISNEEVSDRRQLLYDQAIADFTQAIRLDPNSSQTYRERGVAYSDKGDPNRGLSDLNQAIRLSPNYAMAYNNRGNIHRRMGNHDLAIADYSQAIRIDPNFARAYMNRGGVYRDRAEFNRAIGDLNQAIILAPNDAVAFINRGSYYLDVSNYDRAILDFSQAIRLDPNNAVTYGHRGNAYFRKGDLDRAIADYESGLRIDPSRTTLRNNLELARQQRGR